jgi:hypothetical protein
MVLGEDTSELRAFPRRGELVLKNFMAALARIVGEPRASERHYYPHPAKHVRGIVKLNLASHRRDVKKQ